MKPYAPAPWLPNRHLMTAFGSLGRRPARLALARERVELPDGDFVDVDRASPSPGAPLAVVCHGLEGSSAAPYVRGLARELLARGVGVALLNFRGCSGEENRLPRFYHSGDTGDLAFLVDRLGAERPERPLALAGFSLGGNVVVKYLGERGERAAGAIRAAAVLSVPFDLARCAAAIDGPGVPALLYRERFLLTLRRKAIRKASRHPGAYDVAAVRRSHSLRAYDDALTAPLHGFHDAVHYWTACSSGPLLPEVRRPLLAIAAEDDPFIPADAIPRRLAASNPRVELEVFREGGHVGFVAGPPWRPGWWAEARMAEFLAEKLR